MAVNQLATLEYGKAIRGYHDQTEGVPVFGTNGQIGFHDEALCPYPGVIVGRKGAYRGIHYADRPFFVIDTAFYLKPKTAFDLRWAYYQLLNFDINRLDSGSAIPSTSREAFYAIPVELPPVEIQKRIASILSAYDDLIENNIRRIRIVKEIAKTVFNGASASFPKAWSLVPIREIYEELFDGPHATPKPSTSGPIFLGIKNVTEQGELDLTDIRHIAEDDFSQWTRRVLPRPGDIVFTYEATLHRYAKINRDFRGCLGRRLALIRPNQDRIDSYLLLRCLLSDEWRGQVQSKIIAGATVDRIPLVSFPEFSIRVPKPEVQAQIGPPIRACEELAENCRRRNDLLRTTRDFLLPKLISGEISVEAADEAAAELIEQPA